MPTDAAFRAPCFGKEDKFWKKAEKYKPREDASEATMAIEKEEEIEASLFKPEYVWRFPIERVLCRGCPLRMRAIALCSSIWTLGLVMC